MTFAKHRSKWGKRVRLRLNIRGRQRLICKKYYKREKTFHISMRTGWN